jgi:hypothetical protein
MLPANQLIQGYPMENQCRIEAETLADTAAATAAESLPCDWSVDQLTCEDDQEEEGEEEESDDEDLDEEEAQ